MTVEYLKKAQTNLHAIAKLEPAPLFECTVNLPVTINVLDTHDEIVFRAVIAMWISPKSE